MENDLNNHQSRNFLKEMKNFKRGFQSSTVDIKDTNAVLLTNERQVTQYLETEYFEGLLNQEPPRHDGEENPRAPVFIEGEEQLFIVSHTENKISYTEKKIYNFCNSISLSKDPVDRIIKIILGTSQAVGDGWWRQVQTGKT